MNSSRRPKRLSRGTCPLVLLLLVVAIPLRAQTVEYIHTDALGSLVAVTDANKNIIQRSEYEPYGVLLNRPMTDGPGYTGHVADSATGMTYMQQRYYDPQIGRFLSMDPVAADGYTGQNFNRYWYAANNPYKDRDPRLKEYIVYNGNSIKSAVSTYEGAAQDGINSLLTSTRTGYYIRKFMDSGVNFAPGTNVVNTQHFMTHFRFTEVLLNYAEAANEAWGPDSDPEGFGFTARKIVEAIRKRAGLKLPDAYLTAITSKEDFRNLLRTERRIELCFEGHRFWDIRRWNDVASMTLPVSSMTISTDQTKFTVSKVEDRLFQPFMVYGPIPFNETLKYNIVQNKGWKTFNTWTS